MKKQRFTKSNRILKRYEFQHIFDKGKRYRKSSFSVYMLLQQHGMKRLGLIVSKKIGNAVERNRIKRIIREIFRKNKSVIICSDILFVTYPSMKHMSYKEIEKPFLEIFS